VQFAYKPGNTIQGKLSYIDQDKAIDFVPVKEIHRPGRHGPSAAIIIARTLQVEFLVNSGCLLYVWGYMPKENWQQTDSLLLLKEARPGMVFVSGVAGEVVAGSAYGTDLDSASPFYYRGSGHLLIGELEKADVLVEFATNTVIGLKDGRLCCVVLRPIIS